MIGISIIENGSLADAKPESVRIVVQQLYFNPLQQTQYQSFGGKKPLFGIISKQDSLE